MDIFTAAFGGAIGALISICLYGLAAAQSAKELEDAKKSGFTNPPMTADEMRAVMGERNLLESARRDLESSSRYRGAVGLGASAEVMRHLTPAEKDELDRDGIGWIERTDEWFMSPYNDDHHISPPQFFMVPNSSPAKIRALTNAGFQTVRNDSTTIFVDQNVV